MIKDFINGMSYLLKPIHNIVYKKTDLIPSGHDIEMLKNDWENIGKDIKKAINEYKTS